MLDSVKSMIAQQGKSHDKTLSHLSEKIEADATEKKETNIELTREMLEIRGDNLKLNCNPVFRNEIFMHKPQIQDSLKEQKVFLSIV